MPCTMRIVESARLLDNVLISSPILGNGMYLQRCAPRLRWTQQSLHAWVLQQLNHCQKIPDLEKNSTDSFRHQCQITSKFQRPSLPHKAFQLIQYPVHGSICSHTEMLFS